MNQEKQNAVKKKRGIIRQLIGGTPFWAFLSALKLTFIRMSKTAPYWRKSTFIQTFRYFMAVEQKWMNGDFLNWFRVNKMVFGIRPMEWHLMDAIVLEKEYGLVAKIFADGPPALIVDAGANVGMFSIYALSTWPSAKVFAVEPDPGTFSILEQNQKKNPFFDWRVFQYALWEKDGEVSFENEEMSMASHISTGETASRSLVKVPAIRLDHFFDQYLPKGQRISLLKMDIEGAEEAVLLASRKALANVDLILLEIHSGQCNEHVVREILKKEFPYLYDLSTPSTQYPVVMASQKPLTHTGF